MKKGSKLILENQKAIMEFLRTHDGWTIGALKEQIRETEKFIEKEEKKT